MKIILLKDVKGVGRRFEEKEVLSGYASNFLIPQKLAVPTTSAAEIIAIKNREEKSKSDELLKLEEKIKSLGDLEIKASGNESGHLFASVGKVEIAEKTDLPKEIIMLEKPIKEFGDYTISIKVGGKEKKLKLAVTRS